MMNLNHTIRLSVAVLTTAFVTGAYAAPVSDFQLIINDSDPSHVTVTATGTDPFEPDSAHTFNEGIDLANFFSTPDPTDESVLFSGAGTLTTGFDGSPTYVDLAVDDFTGRYVDLNLFNSDSADPETFQFGTSAFTGTEVFDLSNLAPGVLPTGIERGAIFAGYSADTNPPLQVEALDDDPIEPGPPTLAGFLTYIGDYEVIPEPSQWSLLLLGAAGLLAVHRLRTRRANS